MDLSTQIEKERERMKRLWLYRLDQVSSREEEKHEAEFWKNEIARSQSLIDSMERIQTAKAELAARGIVL